MASIRCWHIHKVYATIRVADCRFCLWNRLIKAIRTDIAGQDPAARCCEARSGKRGRERSRREPCLTNAGAEEGTRTVPFWQFQAQSNGDIYWIQQTCPFSNTSNAFNSAIQVNSSCGGHHRHLHRLRDLNTTAIFFLACNEFKANRALCLHALHEAEDSAKLRVSLLGLIAPCRTALSSLLRRNHRTSRI